MSVRPLKHSLQQFENYEYIQRMRMTKFGGWKLDIEPPLDAEQFQCRLVEISYGAQPVDTMCIEYQDQTGRNIQIRVSIQSFNGLLSRFRLPAIQLDDHQDVMAVSIDIVKQLVFEPICATSLVIHSISIDTQFDMLSLELSEDDYMVEIFSGHQESVSRILIQGLDLIQAQKIPAYRAKQLVNVSCAQYSIIAGAHLPVHVKEELKPGQVFMIHMLHEPVQIFSGSHLESEIVTMGAGAAAGESADKKSKESKPQFYECKVIRYQGIEVITKAIENYNNQHETKADLAYIFLKDRILCGTPFQYQDSYYFLIQNVTKPQKMKR